MTNSKSIALILAGFSTIAASLFFANMEAPKPTSQEKKPEEPAAPKNLVKFPEMQGDVQAMRDGIRGLQKRIGELMTIKHQWDAIKHKYPDSVELADHHIGDIEVKIKGLNTTLKEIEEMLLDGIKAAG